MNPTAPGLLTLSSFLMSRTGQAARRRLANQAERQGLRLWHVMVLCALEEEGGQAKGELAARLDIGPSDMIKVIDDLLAAGYVTCTRSPADRRRVHVDLTAQGRVAASRINSDLAATDDEVLAPLSREERRRLFDMLNRLNGHLGQADDDPDEAGARQIRKRGR
ncbi:MarR family winged helix-turn-helix transcriptional regulator [Kitasatospora sp. NPDC058218]|uniref:MarR family winged helix-turn-helix transcriptional regulator n=1 Tax=Kitasatospora sp. NPDC058218 TaxID=3346385 RepID=UPI0036DEBA92